MAEPLPSEPALVTRAQRLAAISMAAPLVIFAATVVTLVFYGRPHTGNFLGLAVCSMIFLIVIAWLGYWRSRDRPYSWRSDANVASYFNVVLFLSTMYQSREDLRFQLALPTFIVVIAVLTVGILVTGWVPARRAAHMVLDDLSPDVVNSSLIISFRSRIRRTRPRSVIAIHVTPDALEVVWRKANGRVRPSYPLTDVAAITVRTEPKGGAYPIPGVTGSAIEVEPGEVVVFDLPDGQLVFPARDPERLQTFAENRCRALVGDG